MKTYQIIIAAFSIFIAAIIIGGGALYLLGSFYALTFNPAKWTDSGRYALMFLWFVVFVAACMVAGIFIYYKVEK